MNIHLGPLWIHRLEQWDLDCWPIVCIHWHRPGRSTRVFCLWRWGIQVRPFMLTSRAVSFRGRVVWRWGQPTLAGLVSLFLYFWRDLGQPLGRALRSAWREVRKGR